MGVTVKVNHMRAGGVCVAGTKNWFRTQPHLSWRTFVREGYDAEVIRATGDVFAIRVAEVAEKEAAGGK